MTEIFDLTDRVAVVTGGSRGLGLQMALAFAAAGADVVVAARTPEPCEAAARKVRDLGRRALPVAMDVSRWDDNELLADAAYGAFGKVDVLVNNAGMSPPPDSSYDTPEELFDLAVGVNFKGPFRLTSIIGPRMVASGSGSIINISASGTHPRLGPYAGAKAALTALTTVFALEYAPTVRVNTIAAGPFLTDAAADWPDDDRKHTPSALGRPGRPKEIVGTALYLAGDASSFTTGALIRVDGGPA